MRGLYLGLNTDAKITALISELLTNGTKTYQYDSSDFASTYGQGYLGDIVISLEYTSGHYNQGNHATEAVGTDAEFTLEVEYIPRNPATRNNERNITSEDYHTTPNESAGDPTNAMTSSNHHKITVFDREIQVVKVDANGNPITVGTATFDLYRIDASGSAVEGLPTDKKYTKVGNSLVTNASNGTTSTAVLANPTKNTDANATQPYETGASQEVNQSFQKYYIDETEYYLLETAAPSGYTKYDQPVVIKLDLEEKKTPVSKDANGNVILFNWDQEEKASVTIEDSSSYVTVDPSGSPIKISIKNDKPTDLDIIKTDNASTPKTIGGAKFTLTKDKILQKGLTIVAKDGGATVPVDSSTGEFVISEGGITIKNLLGGDYVLTETTPPAGYIKTIQDVKFKVDGAGTIMDISDESNAGKVTFLNKEYKIQNEPGVALPSTGGTGTTFIYLLGSVLTALAGAGLVMKIRRRAYSVDEK